MKKISLKAFLITLFGIFIIETATTSVVHASALDQQHASIMVQESGEKGNCPGPTWGEDSVTAVREYSLYDQYFAQKNYKDAIPHWRHVLLNAPKARLGVYVDGETLMEYQIENASDEARKEELIDTLMWMYDQRIACFDKECYVLGKKGVDLMKFRPSAYAQAYEILKRSVDCQGNDVLITVPYTYMFALVRLYKDKQVNLDTLLSEYERIGNITQHNIDANGQYVENWKKVQAAIDNLVAPLVPCEELIEFYRKKYQPGSTPAKDITQMTEMLSSRNCTKDPFYLTLAKADYSNNPSGQAALAIAKGEEAAGNTNEALKYYKDALEQATSANDKADINYSIARIYKNRDECSTARNYARASASHREDARVYILLGDIIIACASDCDDKIPRSVYWVAVDYYQKAKSLNSSNGETANSRIATYSAYFPKQEDVFFYNLKDGDSYTVECWIQESTKVRTRK
ncbi:MAG: hypothetical protein WD077_10305 [Bacteroidia bacterium]